MRIYDCVVRDSSIPRKSLRYRTVKRIFDILFSGAVIVVGAVPGLVVALMVMVDTKGSPFYLQERVGQYGEPFRIVKLRTMVADSDDLEKHLSAEQLDAIFDPRVFLTRTGPIFDRLEALEF